jgi:nicotinamidase-related amidase
MTNTPRFYEPARIGTLFHPDLPAIAAQAESAGLPPADRDARRILLLIVDMQVDFCHERGALHVPGALEDLRRLIEFIHRRAAEITGIICSLDSHHVFQIFHPAWWVDAHGSHPPPFTIITRSDLEQGRWRPVLQPEWSLGYVRKLEEAAKKQLTIWPYHVPIGGVGNALDPELWSTIFWHAIARRSRPRWLVKGSIPETEHYSILRPEIEIDANPQGRLNRELLGVIEACDRLVVAGEASSHCVLETLEDLVDVLGDRPDRLARIRLLTDCTSPVRHPQIDFGAIAADRFREFAARGLQLAPSTDPL